MSKNTSKKTGKKKVPYIVIVAILVLLSLWLEEPESAESTSGNNHVESTETAGEETQRENYVEYYFRNENLLEQHYEKHGIEMGFDSMEEYEEAACAVIYNPDVLTKTEQEDGDYVYYVEETNEFVVLSQDGYIRTYFNPSAGIDYYNRQ